MLSITKVVFRLPESNGPATVFGKMDYVKPQHSFDKVDAAGQALITSGLPGHALEEAQDVVNNWRSAHAFPLNTFQIGLRGRALSVDKTALVAQRLKRMVSIDRKLRDLDWLKLSKMQDVGGCRAVVSSVPRVRQLVRAYKTSSLKHHLIREKDYIQKPRPSGYRSHHLVYAYHSDRNPTWDDLSVEIQLRSPLQHTWATAVETVGTFLQQSLKSSQGEADWLRFFALMGTAMARRERTAPVPNTPTSPTELVDELREYTRKLDVEESLAAFGTALGAVGLSVLRGAHYYLLVLDSNKREIAITGFDKTLQERASAQYLQTEREIGDEPGVNAVLVIVDDLRALRRAYPNYFLDTKMFLHAVGRAMRDKDK